VRATFALFVAIGALTACAASPEPVKAPAGWHLFDVGPFSFYAPADVEDALLNGRAIDSYVRQFQGKSLFLMFDYGPYSSSFEGEDASLRSHEEMIGGRTAKFVSYEAIPKREFRYPNFVGAYFSRTGKRSMRLSMVASCDGFLSCRDAEDIFRTIRFR
jgi:hypothetical protein